MLLKDIEIPYKEAYSPGFSKQFLASYISQVKEENYLSLLSFEIKFLSSLSLEQRAEAAEVIMQYAKENKPQGLHKKFLFELASVVAPAYAALRAQKDYEMNKSSFRQKNGAYSSGSNNCRHYCFKLYYQALQNVLENESISNKKIHGRPKNFDWKGENCRIRRMPPQEWDALDGKDKEGYFEGNAAFVAYVFSAKDVEKIKKFIEPGDLIGVDHNPIPNPNAQTEAERKGLPHVGICTPDKSIVHIRKPLEKHSMEKFTSRASTVVIYRLASREQQVDISFGSLLPLGGEF